MRRLALVACLLAASTSLAADPEPGKPYEKRWVYAMFNLQVDQSADEVVRLIERSAKAGYNGLVLADYKLNVLERVPDHYFRNIARVKAAADRAGMEIIPAVFPIGYSDGLLAHDVNLAEGLPVVDAPFVVKGGEAKLVPDPKTKLRNGDLEETRGYVFPGFGYQDAPGKATFADRETVHGGKVAMRIQDPAKNNPDGNCRLIQSVKVRPHTAYRFSAWAKTKDLQRPGDFHLNAIGSGPKGRQLAFQEGAIDRTHDWRRVEVVFNSLDFDEVNLYAGLWGGGSGTLWLDDLALEELSLVNVLRRDGCPLRVTSADGRKAFVEGRDFEKVADPKLGVTPYAGEYEFDHPPARMKLTSSSSIQDGDRLLVSWYHPVLTQGTQVMCCLTEPKVFDILRDQAKRVESLLKPKTYFLGYDEIRVANWCASCQAKKATPGRLLADHARRSAALIHEINPKAEVVYWSDMFDPNHNAVDQYYLVNGSLKGSWEGLPKDAIIANWNGGKAAASLRFFADRGHRQILAGYYDADDLSGFHRWHDPSRGVKGVVGFMYTTWEHKFRLLEEYGKAIGEYSPERRGAERKK